jgi:uncharacterized membrane-anchored protein
VVAKPAMISFLVQPKIPSMIRTSLSTLLLLITFVTRAQEIDSVQQMIDDIESRLQYETGEIKLENGIGTLQVPSGFKYLNPEQSAYVLKDLWGNPDGSGTLGMIVPENNGLLADNAWAFIVTYEEMGYVKDDDADDIDYDELLADMQKDTETANEERSKAGYEPIKLIGWAAKPFYDEKNKVLHWAKEIKFGEAESNTLNYNVRVLGRKGVIVLNAVASMTELLEVEKSITPVLSSFSYADGNKYSDFNPDIDEVAAWTIGGLVAGKVLAKIGVLAFLLKYIKLIGIAVVALFGGLWKWYKKKTELPTVKNLSDTTES